MAVSIESSIDELLKVPEGVEPVAKARYLDVLGDRASSGSRRGQQVFQRKSFPLIYERVWRPIVSRFFFGFSGLSAEKERRMTLAALDVSRGDRVIDIGCGTGDYTRHLASASEAGLVVGIDASETMVAAAARRGHAANLVYLRADAAALPFRDGAFDAVCTAGTIHMIEEPLSALDEMIRVLAPGGRLSIVTSYVPGASRRIRGGVTFLTRDEVTGALRERGFDGIEQHLFRRGQIVFARMPAEDPVGR
jgi:SAM-dependent methyltransferase